MISHIYNYDMVSHGLWGYCKYVKALVNIEQQIANIHHFLEKKKKCNMSGDDIWYLKKPINNLKSALFVRRMKTIEY